MDFITGLVTYFSRGHGAPAITASTSSTVRGQCVMFSIPSLVMITSSSRRTPPNPRNRSIFSLLSVLPLSVPTH